MDSVTPSNAYDLLDDADKPAVDEYCQLLVNECHRRGERIANVIDQPVPNELVKRSRGVLARPLVRAAIAERLREMANNQDVSPSRVVREHAAIAFSNMSDYVQFGMFGEIMLNLKGCTREKMAAIKSIEITDTPTGPKTKLTLYDKVPSLNALQAIMVMPQITDVARGGASARIAKGDNAEKAYSNLLESMRVQP